MTRLCVSIFVEAVEQALAQAAVAAERGAEMLEFRIDRFTDDPDALERLIEKSPLPCIVTCRPTWEGGEYEGDEQQRIALLERLGLKQPAYIDLELAAFEKSANLRQKIKLVVDHPRQVRPTGTGLILSAHDFNDRPPDLTGRFNAIAEQPAARVIKLAWRARSLRDNLEAFELLLSRAKPSIMLCMGEFGLPSRVLAKKYGALLTFVGMDDATVTAPGQVGIETIKQHYRWDAIGETTKVYGVIGWPVGHSLSPHIHNAGFDACGVDGVYLPMPIPDDYVHFKATVGAWLDFQPLDFYGASVTIPHKQNLLRFVAERGGQLEPLAEAIGAANTLTVRDGSLIASNTDCLAALDAVCHAMGIGRTEAAGLNVTVIGAGGAARAVAAGFAAHGAHVTIYNRTAAKARRMAEQFNPRFSGRVTAAPLGDLPGSSCDVCINCTSLGMHPHVDGCPLQAIPSAWGEQTVVFDTIYNPMKTRLMRMAHEAGCITVSGVEMFIRQAAEQFEQWTGQPAPVEVFRAIVSRRLERRD